MAFCAAEFAADFVVASCYVMLCVKMDEKNKLYFGDNLKILREYVPDASVDLIYLDPPFNSSATYNVLFKEKSGEESAAQITAFEDTWQSSVEAEAVYKEIVTSGPRKIEKMDVPAVSPRPNQFPERACPFGFKRPRENKNDSHGAGAPLLETLERR